MEIVSHLIDYTRTESHKMMKKSKRAKKKQVLAKKQGK
jgi:hypothetical protein